jgi:RNA recognition motif-containing protein
MAWRCAPHVAPFRVVLTNTSGRAIRCNWANSKTQAGPGGAVGGTADYATIAAQAPITNTTVYIGNLSPDATEPLIQAAFQEFGTIEEIRLQHEKGFAFVRYTSHDFATRAIAGMNGRPLAGKPVRCSWGKEAGAMPQQVGVTAGQMLGIANPMVMNPYTFNPGSFAPTFGPRPM